MSKYVVLNVLEIEKAVKEQLGKNIIVDDIEDTENGIVVHVSEKYYIPMTIKMDDPK